SKSKGRLSHSGIPSYSQDGFSSPSNYTNAELHHTPYTYSHHDLRAHTPSSEERIASPFEYSGEYEATKPSPRPVRSPISRRERHTHNHTRQHEAVHHSRDNIQTHESTPQPIQRRRFLETTTQTSFHTRRSPTPPSSQSRSPSSSQTKTSRPPPTRKPPSRRTHPPATQNAHPPSTRTPGPSSFRAQRSAPNPTNTQHVMRQSKELPSSTRIKTYTSSEQTHNTQDKLTRYAKYNTQDNIRPQHNRTSTTPKRTSTSHTTNPPDRTSNPRVTLPNSRAPRVTSSHRTVSSSQTSSSPPSSISSSNNAPALSAQDQKLKEQIEAKLDSLKRKPNFYELLEIPLEASKKEIRSAYRKMSRTFHPDRVAGGPL
ncbi:MAG: J domain-containing protein, partial [Myxococcota bacterium]